MTYSTSSSSTSKKFRSTSRYKSDSSLSSDSSCSAPSLNSTSNSDSVSNGSFYQPGFSFFDQGNVSYDYHDGAYSPFEASMQRIQSNQFKPQQAFPHKTKLTKKDREKLRLEKIEVKKVLSKKMVKFSELSDSLAASAPPAQLENPTPSFTKDLFKIDESKEQEMFTKAEELFNDGCYIATAQQFTLICFYTSNPQSKCRAFKEGISAIGYAENKRYAEDQKRAEGEKKGPVNPQFHNNLYFAMGAQFWESPFMPGKSIDDVATTAQALACVRTPNVNEGMRSRAKTHLVKLEQVVHAPATIEAAEAVLRSASPTIPFATPPLSHAR